MNPTMPGATPGIMPGLPSSGANTQPWQGLPQANNGTTWGGQNPNYNYATGQSQHPRPHGPNAQGYSPIHYGQNNLQVGYAKVGQARYAGGVPQLAAVDHPASGGNAVVPPELLGGRFAVGKNTGKIIDTKAGAYTPEDARQYQLLYNWAQRNGVNIVGQGGQGGGYDPNIVYAQPNRYVDLRTGLANPPSTGASADAGAFIGPDILTRLRQKAGFDPAIAARDAQRLGVAALGPGTNGEQYTNLGTGYIAPYDKAAGGKNAKAPKWLSNQGGMAQFNIGFNQLGDTNVQKLMALGAAQGLSKQDLMWLASKPAQGALFNGGNQGGFDMGAFLEQHPDQIGAAIAQIKALPGGKNDPWMGGAGTGWDPSSLAGYSDAYGAWNADQQAARGGMPPRFFTNTNQPGNADVAQTVSDWQAAAANPGAAIPQTATTTPTPATATTNTTAPAAATPAAQTAADTVKQTATLGYTTPQAAIQAGMDPSKDIAYWSTQGWQYNPATTQWTQTAQPQTLSGAGHQVAHKASVAGDTLGGYQPYGADPGYTGGLPIDATYEAQRRLAQAQLDRQLGTVGPAREAIASQGTLQDTRLNNDAVIAQQNLKEALIARGALQSSLYASGLGDLATSVGRSKQDLAAQLEQAYGQLALTSNDAYGAYEQAIQEALLALAQRAANDQNTVVPHSGPARRKAGNKKARRR
jgi:hypothetical protein